MKVTLKKQQPAEKPEKKLGILEHLKELRMRLLKSVIAIIVGAVLAFIFADYIFDILVRPAQGYTLVAIDMTEMFSTYMKVCLVAGIILAMPVITYHFLMFVTPALKPKEKRSVTIILPWIALMFAGGVIFGYFILLPPAMNFLFNFGSDIALIQVRIGNYISIVLRFLLAIGLVFELPVITTFLSRIGVINSAWLARKRKVFIIVAFVVAAIITPTMDPVNQCLVAGPLIALYEIGILLAKIVQKKKKPETAPAVNASAP